jgi:hypothetical protein
MLFEAYFFFLEAFFLPAFLAGFFAAFFAIVISPSVVSTPHAGEHTSTTEIADRLLFPLSTE